MRKVLVAMPGHVGPTFGAAVGLFNCTADRTLAKLRPHTSSLLANAHNVTYCEALNGWLAGEVSHFAVLHADVEPENGWLDILLAEMDAGGFDVLGGVVPLKDERGLTSLAVDRADGFPWMPAKRLSLAEVYALPDTFTSEDVGGPLLLNTGLLLVKLGPWSERCWFTINDCLAKDANGRWTAAVESEDWFYSRKAHAAGVKVGATRRVRLNHRGPVPFTNAAVWGTRATDTECIAANAAEVTP